MVWADKVPRYSPGPPARKNAWALEPKIIGAGLQIAGDPEAIVGVLEFWRNAGSGGAACDFDLVTPGTSARRLPRRLHRTLFRTERIAIRRNCVVVGIVPVATPFVDVVANVVQAESIWGISCDRLRTGLPSGRVIRQRLRRIISPGELRLFKAAASSKFPFGFGGKTERTSGLRAEPFAVMRGLVPGSSSDWLLRMVEVGILPERWRDGAGCSQETVVFCVGDLRCSQVKRVDPHAMDGAFAVLPGVRAHQEG